MSHSSTGRSPAELLFNRPLHTQIPTLDNKCYASPEVQKRDQDEYGSLFIRKKRGDEGDDLNDGTIDAKAI